MSKHLRTTQRESSAPRGWLSFFSEDAPQGGREAGARRLVLGFALALAVHEIVAGVFPWGTRPVVPPQREEVMTVARIVRITHRPTPKPRPTPRPTPQPTPRVIVHPKFIAPEHVLTKIVNPGASSQNQHIRRIASAHPMVHTRYHAKPATVHVPAGGQGIGTSTTAKALTGGIGTGGNGTGENGTGNGTGGAPAADEPCGYVDFEILALPTNDSRTGRVWEHVGIVVHFPDGSTDSVPLDYPFYYPSKAEDPFQRDTTEAAFQFPPESARAQEPPLVQYVMAHTTTNGLTTLKECPKR